MTTPETSTDRFQWIRAHWIEILGTSILIAIYPTLYFAPALFEGKLQATGESINISYPLFHHLAEAIRGHRSMLWSENVYGGHPLFAEGQGGFANPLVIGLAALAPSPTGFGAMLWLNAWLFSAGLYWLCRSNGLSLCSSALASIAIGFSPVQLLQNGTLPVALTTTWTPWCLLALDRIVRNPGIPSALALATPLSLLVVSGYPQILHGTLLFCALQIAVHCFDRDSRTRRWLAPRIGYAITAVLLATGISAIQWIPLLELARLSIRRAGIDLVPVENIDILLYKSELITGNVAAVFLQRYGVDLFGSMTIAICAIAGACFARRRLSARYALPAGFLCFLVFFDDSALFRILYDYELIPGLHAFRSTALYWIPATSGFAVLFAAGIDSLITNPGWQRFIGTADTTASGGLAHDIHRPFMPNIALFVLGAASFALLYNRQDDSRFDIHVVCTGLAAIAIAASALIGKGRTAYAAVACLILAELFITLTELRGFVDPKWIREPRPLTRLRNEFRIDDYKFHDQTLSIAHILIRPDHDDFLPSVVHMTASFTPMTNLYWDIPSSQGALALMPENWKLAETTLDEELSGRSRTQPGNRLIDHYGIRFIARYTSYGPPDGFRPLHRYRAGIEIVENPHALQRFRSYSKALSAGTGREALALIETVENDTLVIEGDLGAGYALPRSDGAQTRRPGFRLIRETPHRLLFSVDTRSGGWLYIDNSHHPGWRARADGVEVPVFRANLLGRAVPLPPGTRRLEMYFRPKSHEFGLAISVSTLVLCVVLWALWNRHASSIESNNR